MAKQDKASDSKDKSGSKDKDKAEDKAAAPDAPDEAGEGETPEGEGLPETPKSKLKKILMIAVPVLVLLGGGGAAAFFLGVFGGHDEGEQVAAPVVTKPVFFDMPDMLVNINGRQRRTSFLKVAVSLELKSAGDIERIQQSMPRVVDSFQVYLRELRSDDLTSSAGMMRLREDLLLRVNETVAPAKVRDILFREMLIQ